MRGLRTLEGGAEVVVFVVLPDCRKTWSCERGSGRRSLFIVRELGSYSVAGDGIAYICAAVTTLAGDDMADF